MMKDKAMVECAGWLGDFTWVVPFLRRLSQGYDSISVAVSDKQMSLGRALTIDGTVDNVFVDQSGKRRIGAWWDTTRQVRRDGIKTFIDLVGKCKTAMYIPWVFGSEVYMPHAADRKKGRIDEIAARILHPGAKQLPRRKVPEHFVDYYLRIAYMLGIDDNGINFDLAYQEPIERQAQKLTEEKGLEGAIALCIGAGQMSKTWDPENWQDLALDLLRRGKKVVIMGAQTFKYNGHHDTLISNAYFTPGGEHWKLELRDYMDSGQLVNLVPVTDFDTDCYLFQSGVFDIIIGFDSFNGHIGGSTNTVKPGTEGAIEANGRWWKAPSLSISLDGPTNPAYCSVYDGTRSPGHREGYFNIILFPQRYPSHCGYDREALKCEHYGTTHCAEMMHAHCMNHITRDAVLSAIETHEHKLEIPEGVLSE